MIIASIDIGTNTILLLIAEVDVKSKEIKTIKNYYNMPRIGKGVLPGTNISHDKIELLFDILYQYKKESENYLCEKLLLTATNAFRIAKNGIIIKEKVKDILALDIDIIDGEKEAYYSYLGAISTQNKQKINLVIDIGGGSTEIILGKHDEIIYKRSFQIGVVTLSEKFLANNPPIGEEIAAMTTYIRKTFSELHKFANENIYAVAVAGTPTTLSCIKQNIKEYSDDKVEGSILTKNDLINLTNKISKQSNSEIIENYGSVVNGREDVLLSGTIILESLCEIINLDEINVSSKGLRYGAIINYLNNLP